MNIQLSPRLKVIADSVIGAKSMADIGTDHGYLPVTLVAENQVSTAIAVDVNKMPLEKAKKIISTHGLEKSIETRLGSGLSVLEPGEVEVIVIAGMGGLLIRDCLKADSAVAQNTKKLILQPMNNQKILRRYLEENGYQITREELAQEDERIYEVMVVEPGEMVFTNPLEYDLGHHFMANKHPLLKALIDRKISLEEKILENTRGKDTSFARQQFLASEAYIKKLNEVKKCL